MQIKFWSSALPPWAAEQTLLLHFQCSKRLIPHLQRSCQAFVVLTWLNTTSNSRAYKRWQSTLCELSAGWAGTFHFIHHSKLAVVFPWSHPGGLKQLMGKKNFLLGLDTFSPLLLSVQCNGAQLFIVCPLLENTEFGGNQRHFAGGTTLNPLNIPRILLCPSLAGEQHFPSQLYSKFHLAVCGLYFNFGNVNKLWTSSCISVLLQKGYTALGMPGNIINRFLKTQICENTGYSRE